MIKNIFFVMGALVLLAIAAVNAKATNAKANRPSKPDHLVYMVFDQMRPDYVDRYNLKNFKELRAKSENYINGYVGHMGAVTIVSHAVMSTGLLPQSLPWQDDVFWDHDGLLGKKDGNYNTTMLSMDQLLLMLKGLGENQFLATKIKKLGGQTIAIGEKNYAAITFGGPFSDRIVTLLKKDGRCLPTGVNVPEYIASNDRYKLECANKFGTDESFYPLDGNRYYPGTDEKHLGGDIWTADAAIEVMNHEKWSGLFLTFGAIDRIGHMTGEDDWKIPRSYETPLDLEGACRIADAQLGRIIAELKRQNLFEQTLIVVTADHGGQSNTFYLGNGEADTVGQLENAKPEEVAFWPKRLNDTNLIRLGTFDSGMRFWFKDSSPAAAEKLLKLAREISGAVAIYIYDRPAKKYRRAYENLAGELPAFKVWAQRHYDELVGTMASGNGPDMIVLLKDNVGFDRIGDHGGAQERVQRIPMMIFNPRRNGISNPKPTRLVDLKATITDQLGL